MNWSWPNYPAFDLETLRKAIRITGVPAEIQIKHIPNTRLECFVDNLFGFTTKKYSPHDFPSSNVLLSHSSMNA
jgi:hypothetical protein